MKTTLVLLFTALLMLPLALKSRAQHRETMIDERFSVSEGGTLEIHVGDADVEVETGASDAVHVEVIVEARDMERGREFFERQNFDVSQSGNTVRVETNQRANVRFSWRDWRNQPHIYVHVTVPETFDADLHTADGDITLDRLRGEIRLRTSDGDVNVGALTGGNLFLSTSDGDINADDLQGQVVELETSDGDLDLGTISAERILARTSDGDIRTGALSGEAEVKTSDGDIHIATFNGSSFFARTSDGAITVEELIAETSTVRSSDGAITLRRVEGDLDVSGSSTDIRLDLRNPGDISATTSDGDITITVPEGHRADVRLRGDDVRVASSLDFNGRIEDEHAEGAINGGGARLEARTSDGDVSLRGN
jgi:DUF4097 and DUF4098 domain-containing protein YvlB